MKRKIVRQGKSTMTISLPASWIHKYNLNDGDELELEENGNAINITAGEVAQNKKIEIDSTKLGKFTKRDLSHLYILGYDEIIIYFNDSQILKEIKQRVPDCIGYEIIEQQENKLLIKTISSAMDNEFEIILRKVFLMLKEMSEGCYEAISNSEFSRLKQIRDLETLNNKFTSFLLRVLNKKGYSIQNRTLQAYDMIQNLERLADEYKYLCDNFSDTNKNIDKKVIILLKEVHDYFNLFYSLHYKKDNNKLITLHEKRNSLMKNAEEFFKKNQENVLIHHIMCLIEKIYNTSGSSFALSIK
jgi:phosphate uptake regulator